MLFLLLELQLLGKKLDKKDWFGSSDPFLVFSRTNEGGSYTVVHKTEHIKNNVNPLWKKFFIPVRTLCNGDYDRNIKVECFDHNLNGSHKLIGKMHALKKYDQFTQNTSCFWGCITPVVQFHEILCYKNNE